MSEPIESTISPWMPEQNRIRLAVLGKLAEECNELGARCARATIQGLDERDPATGRTNREEIARKIADVLACIQTAEDRLDVFINLERISSKFTGLRRWHRMIENGEG